ncbi:MAG: AAA family ATPase [Thermoleophilia bacterium]|nr:AAA family ATPase [Thermoleophilia bacterium]
MIVGREAECARIDRLLDEARAARSAALLVRGEPGIGKTALCEYAEERADGMAVLRARGVVAESELAFAGLADLLKPVLDRLDAIPEPQAAAIAGALALGPPAAGDRFTVCAATLSLLATVAEHEPVLVVVDDAHWLDRSSSEALLFAARRLEAESVALLAAVRAGEAPMLEQAGLPELEVGGLSVEAVRALVGAAAGTAPDDEVAERLQRATGGNPLALREIAAVLTADELRGARPLREELPFGTELERAFARRIAELPADVRRALVVVAAADGGPVDATLAALAQLGLGEQALVEAESAGVLAVRGEQLAFAHPLLRAAAYHGAAELERRTAHRALAGAAGGRVPAERRALHLAAATPSPDEGVADALEESARRARARGGAAEAGRGFMEAARLSVDGERRARRLLEAANDFRVVGQLDEAFAALEEALASTSDERLRAEIQHVRGRAEMWRGAGGAGYELLVREAAAVAGLDPERAAVMLTDAAMLALAGAETEPALRAAREACRIAPAGGGPVELLCRAALGTVQVVRGEASGAEALGPLLDSLDRAESDLPRHQLVLYAGWALVWAEDYERARSVLGGLAERGRAESAPGHLPLVLAALSDLDFRCGRWASAYAGAAESVRLASETRQLGALPHALASLARVEAAQGREHECRAHAAKALELGRELGAGSVVLTARSALGLLELGLGRAEAAVGDLEEVARAYETRGIGDPGAVQWAPELVEAYVRLGRREEAADALGQLERRADATGRVWARAAALRCRGLLVEDEGDAEAAFAAALALHDELPAPFERARTELALGERLRRARRRADARQWLRSALAAFERLGAVSWLDRARTELHASGESLRRQTDTPLHELTPQELQVALLVAQGATNREAGAALFLSPKTIEAHLGRVYRKLNVRSRTELAHIVASEDVATAA